MQVGRFSSDALTQLFVQGVVTKPALNASQVDMVLLGRESDRIRAVGVGQLDEEAVGVAVSCPRDNFSGEQSMIHEEPNRRHASPCGSFVTSDGATARVAAQVPKMVLSTNPRSPSRALSAPILRIASELTTWRPYG